MVKAVIFDWYGTLAEREGAGGTSYSSVFSAFGYEVDVGRIDDYHLRWDGLDHRAHSTDRDAYLAWTRVRLGELVRHCGVTDAHAAHLVEALVEAEGAPMVLYPEVLGTLQALRDRGVAVGVCSNWGWDLEPLLVTTGVAPLLDAAVTSARVGFRKPHPGIYEVVLGAMGVEAGDALFVGDSFAPDVLGPTTHGMAAVHVVREASRPAPPLPPGARRVSVLGELLVLVDLGGGG